MSFKQFFLVLLIVSLILMSGCTEKNANPSREDNIHDGEKTSQGKIQEKPAPGSVQAVNSSKLIEYLPSAPPDWTAKEPQVFMYAAENGSWSMANKEFIRGDIATASVGIMDSAYYEVGWFLVWKGIYKYESAEGYTKTTTIKGYPALELYSKSDNEYTLYVMIKERFMVYIHVRDADKDALDNMANEIDYADIAALK